MGCALFSLADLSEHTQITLVLSAQVQTLLKASSWHDSVLGKLWRK